MSAILQALSVLFTGLNACRVSTVALAILALHYAGFFQQFF